MATSISNKLISNFSYEIIERIIRFIVHLEEIENQFIKDDKGKKYLIDNYKDALYKLMSFVLMGYKNEREAGINKNEEFFRTLKEVLQYVNELHIKHLSILPRPSEPVELTRFERVIHKQIVQLTEPKMKKNISISINEEIGEKVYGDNLSEYKRKISELFSKNNGTGNLLINELSGFASSTKDKERLNITIPRIDASNTFRWPSLIHEMCHSLFSQVVFENGSIENDFLKFIGGSRDEIFDAYFFELGGEKSQLYKWLEECWCDLFACILIGPSFYFSQYIAFMNVEEETASNTHPPHVFRLDLIESIIRHRFPILYKELLEDTYIADCEELTSFLQADKELSFKEKSKYTRIFNSFNQFFISHFLPFNKEEGTSQLKNNPKISSKLNILVNKYVRIHPEVILYLVGRLKEGLPIPSIKTKNKKGKYIEIPTYVQEIFLASWISRYEDLIPKVLYTIENTKIEEIRTRIDKSYEKIKKQILRHDQAILKSIQVSEWFDFLIEEKRRPEQIIIFENQVVNSKLLSNINGVLVDSEIKTLIFQDELKIIPLMYLNHKLQNKTQSQIGTTSLDIRLGTSFQVFYPDQFGMIDFTQNSSSQNLNDSSKRINLDFIEGITITPRQFILGHSMEYIKLPDYICGNLEGRSSFARLGIEIHMTAGYIDPGFEGVITFEIYNAGPTTVKLYPGMRIGQIRFEKNNKPQEPYSKKHIVKYRGLLEHDVSRQSKDFEVELIRKFNAKLLKHE